MDLYPNISAFRKIDTQLFTSKKIMEREWSHLWTKTWLFAGFTLDLQSPGDWFVHNIGRESIIVVRGNDKKIRAFYNVCRHRGNRLVRGESGAKVVLASRRRCDIRITRTGHTDSRSGRSVCSA